VVALNSAKLPFFQKSLLKGKSILNTVPFRGTVSNTAELPFSLMFLHTRVLVDFEYHLKGQ
jgi:hypothetical protein